MLIRRYARAFLLASGLAGSAFAGRPAIDEPAKMAVISRHPSAWQDFLYRECGVQASALQPTDKRLPVAAFAHYRLVVVEATEAMQSIKLGEEEFALAPGSGYGPLTSAEHDSVQQYLASGGRLLVLGSALSAFEAPGGNVPAGYTGVGLCRWQGGKGKNRLVAPWTVWTRHLTDASLAFFSIETQGGKPTTAHVLSETESGSTLFVNRVGNGAFLFIAAPSPMSAYTTPAWCDDPVKRAELFTVKAMVESALGEDDALQREIAAINVPAPGRVPVVIDGTSRDAVIVTANNAWHVARSLAAMLGRITGRTPPVLAADSTDASFAIHVGRTAYVDSLALDLDALHPAGYCLKVTDDQHLVLAGCMLPGTVYAVNDFLKRFCGFRWFMPGELGEIVPRMETLSLPLSLDIRGEPSFLTYNNAGLHHAAVSFTRSEHINLLATHNLANLFSPQKYGAAHPEYFPLINGRRHVPAENNPGVWQPCVSNPDLPALAIEWAREYLAANPQALGFSLGVNDGGGDCQCDACEALKEKHNNAYIPFYNAVARLAAREFPGKLVGFITYGGAWHVPRNINLESNLYVEVNSGLRDDFRVMRAWREAGARHLGLYDYLYGWRYAMPRHYPHIMGNAWKRASRDFGLRGAWIESYIQSWIYDGPRQYVLNELAWDIEADIDGLLDDYFNRFYGGAAEPVRRFFDRIEVVYGRKPDPLHPSADWGEAQGSPDQLAEYTADDLAYLDRCLAEAAAAAEAGADRDARQRVSLLARLVGLSRLDVIACLKARELSAAAAGEADAERLLRAVRDGQQALDDKAAYELAGWETVALFPAAKQPSQAFRAFKETLDLQPHLEAGAERAFCAITDWIEGAKGWAAARDYWLQRAEQMPHARLRALARSQIQRRENPAARVCLIENPGFDIPAAAAAAAADPPETDIGRFELWAKNGIAPPKGWNRDTFPNSRTRYFWDPVIGHAKPGSLRIGANQIRGSFLAFKRVKPGGIYRFACSVKQEPSGRGGMVTFRWQQANYRWADEGPGATPILYLPYHTPQTGGWMRVERVFQTATNVHFTLILLGAPRGQKEHEATWFDDVTLHELYDPEWKP